MPNPMGSWCVQPGGCPGPVSSTISRYVPVRAPSTQLPMAQDAPRQKSRAMEMGGRLLHPWLGMVSSFPDLCQHKTCCISLISGFEKKTHRIKISFPTLLRFQSPFHPHDLQG